MNKLGFMDASFLYLETDGMPMSIASVQKFAPPACIDYFGRIRTFLAERAQGVPFMTRKLLDTPFALDQPVWITDRQFDIDRHLFRVTLPAPGGDRELETLIGRLHEQPLDRRRPLWAYYFIEGLADGTVAIYEKYHHACIDGIAGQTIMDVLFSEAPDMVPPRLEAQELSEPSPADLLIDAARQLFSQALDAPQKLNARLLSLSRLSERWLAGDGFGALDKSAPRTPFNVSIGPYRSWAMATVPLAEARTVAKAGGASLNDVVMAIGAGALRRYLMRKGALPDAPLLAGVPVSLRAPGDTSLRNQVSMLSASLATHLAAPAARLAEIHASMRAGKALLGDIRGLQPDDLHVPGLAPALARVALFASRTGLANYTPPAVNVVISNVPGPRTRRYLCGGEMLTHYPVSIPGQSVALNMTVQTYVDRIDFGLTACLEAVPDLPALRDDLLEAWSELRDALAPPAPASNPSQQAA